MNPETNTNSEQNNSVITESPGTEQVKEIQTEGIPETTTVVDKSTDMSRKVESKESFLGKLKSKFNALRKDSTIKNIETKEQSDSTESTEQTEELSEKIPDEFIEAAKTVGWTKAQIEDMASDFTDEELLKMIPAMKDGKNEKETTQEVQTETKTTSSEGFGTGDMAELVELAKIKELEPLLKPLLERDAALQKALSELQGAVKIVQQDKSQQELVTKAGVASDFFDETAKSLSVFGNTKDLKTFPDGRLISTTKEMQARNEVWKVAIKFEEMGLPFKQALGEALSWYKGKYAEKDIHAKVLRDLKKNESRLSPKRTETKTSKTFTNSVDEKTEVVLDAARRAGLSV